MRPRQRLTANDDETGFDPLHAIAAQLLVATAADAATSGGQRIGWPRLPTRVPSLIAPIAAVAHLAHMSRPSPRTSLVTRGLDIAVLAAGTGTAMAGMVIGRRSRTRGTLSTFALASAGLLGLVIQWHQQSDAESRRRLQKRASVVERLVPQRRPRLDHIVVHV